MKIFITRHGQTVWNLENKIQGWENSPLTELGYKQASWLSERLKDISFDLIFSSSIKRAYDTAEILKGDRSIDITKVDSLKEMGMGLWEGKTFAKMKNEYPEIYEAYWKYPHKYRPDTGESYYDVKNRVVPWLESLINIKEDINVLIVTHTVVVKILMAYFENRPMEKLWDFPYIHETSLSMVNIENDISTICFHGDISHYRDKSYKSTKDDFETNMH